MWLSEKLKECNRSETFGMGGIKLLEESKVEIGNSVFFPLCTTKRWVKAKMQIAKFVFAISRLKTI